MQNTRAALAAPSKKITGLVSNAKWVKDLRLVASRCPVLTTLAAIQLAACGPHAHIPPRGVVPLPGVAARGDSVDLLARGLAPTLYLQRDEAFPLSRIVAVVHPSRSVIAYHLLWRDDVHGAWIPFTATDNIGIPGQRTFPAQSGIPLLCRRKVLTLMRCIAPGSGPP